MTENVGGDSIPADCEVILVRVGELRQLFNAIDPSPFHDRDLDPNAADFIVDWASGVPRSRPLGLTVQLERSVDAPAEARLLREAVHQFFGRRSAASRRQLRELFRRGRISLVIGLAFLTMSSMAANLLSDMIGPGGILRESILIGGWVAMWRPLEVFLYDWWPIAAEARRYDRLASMPVRVSGAA